VSPSQRGRRARETSVLLVLAIVIVVAIAVNLANLEPLSGSAPPAPGPVPRPSGDLLRPNPIEIPLVWSLVVAAFAFAVFLLLRRRKSIDQPPSSWWSLIMSLVGLLLFVLLLAVLPRTVQPSGNETATADGGVANSFSGVPSLATGSPVEMVILLAIFGAILWTVYRIRSGAGAAADPADEARDGREPRIAATAVVEETIQELEMGADVRTTIIACFQRFCRLLGARGLSDQDASTAREIEGLAVRTFSLSREASASLTSLFEEARYSVHPLGEVDRDRAIEDLRRIQAALEA
jgi:hypothetical protein